MELLELEYSAKRFAMKLIEEPFVIKEAREEKKSLRQVLKPAFIGDPEGGDIFFEIAEF